MKFSLALFIFIYFNIPCSAQLPVHEEPLHHPVLQNSFARILDVKANAGDTSLMHIHSNNYVYVTLHGGKLWLEEASGPREVNLPNGYIDGYFNNPAQPLIHRFSNISDTLVRIIAVENLDVKGSTQQSTSENSMGIQVIDNKWFSVVKVTLEPNDRSALKFSYPAVVINLDAPFLKIQNNGKNRNIDAWAWLEPSTNYTLLNPNNNESHLVIIEIK